MNPPTLPGDLPGLLRRGSPALRDLGPYHAPQRCTIVGESSCGWPWYAREDGGPMGDATALLSGPAEHLLLDLSDATGRAHAEWWLAGRALMLGSYAAAQTRWVHERGEREWSIDAPDDDACLTYSPYAADRDVRVPALADLDPDDPRLMPDGSRWVDAEALRRVCLHVAGRAA
jgi:hypothetical protein